MVTRELVLDEESNRILDSLAEGYGGDVSLAIRDLLRMHGLPESELEALERTHAADLIRQRDRSERDFQEGKVISWSELRRQCGL